MTPHPQHCEHECMCFFYKSIPARIQSLPCKGGFVCKHDTRPHTTPAANENQRVSKQLREGAHLYKLGRADGAKAAREKVLKLLVDLIEKESLRPDKERPNMVYSYRVAQIIESLRSTQPHKVKSSPRMDDWSDGDRCR